MKYQFRRRIWKTGAGSRVVTVPSYLMEDTLKENEEYLFTVEVIQDE